MQLLILALLLQDRAPSLPALLRPHTFPVRATRANYTRGHHDYPATDIFCPVGSLFVAPIAGVVDFVSERDLWDPRTDRPEHRGGIAVAIVGVDGWRYYGSHLQSLADGIRVGERVHENQVLGLVGSTGNARGMSPHLHFGISVPSHSADWKARRGQVDPYPYLQLWRRT